MLYVILDYKQIYKSFIYTAFLSYCDISPYIILLISKVWDRQEARSVTNVSPSAQDESHSHRGVVTHLITSDASMFLLF